MRCVPKTKFFFTEKLRVPRASPRIMIYRFMDYMVKFYHSYNEGYGSYYITYRLYTGSSLIDIKERILKDLSYEFSSVGLGKEISEIDLSSSFDDMCDTISDMVDDLDSYSSSWRDRIEDYEIEISEGKSLNDVIKFYNHFIDHCNELGDDEGADREIAFEFDGELARKIERVIEDGEPIGDYLRDLLSSHDLYIDWKFIDGIKKNLL